jgi:hypothetical protein
VQARTTRVDLAIDDGGAAALFTVDLVDLDADDQK